ncbi:UV excision repair protein RAD23 homolog B-like [Teleopsis dalmanni]|uniref:UV excision repair protein RAD23 homolog B-like n=1 Tax=Teleopsis dalmanni TaxID=139649 RepID=UPI0018CD05B0|nr:UV excision repair protein RAD23 homolog B-like [Teleopsis dalmanni]
MKLQVKTLSQKLISVDIDESKTVYDLKKELALSPIVGVQPELQKLIYAGKILTNEEVLSQCNIDSKKFLVVMVLKQPQEDTPTSSSASAVTNVSESTAESNKKTEAPVPAPAAATTKEPTLSSPAAVSNEEQMVQNIVSMGYPESEVRLALAASFFNPERAIEYLIEGIPAAAESGSLAEYGGEDTVSPLEVFRGDPLFRSLRSAIRQHPEMLDDAIIRIGESNPEILGLINDNQDEFLRMLVEDSDEEDEPGQGD